MVATTYMLPQHIARARFHHWVLYYLSELVRIALIANDFSTIVIIW